MLRCIIFFGRESGVGQNEPSKHVRCRGSFRRKRALPPPHVGVTEQSAVLALASLGLTKNQSVAEIQHVGQMARSKPAVGQLSRPKTHHGPPYEFLEAS
jgi:hypothetical protein